MVCKQCGAPVKSKFCEYCGAKFVGEENIEKSIDGNWPVAILRYDAYIDLSKEEQLGNTIRYCGYDIVTESETDNFKTVEECLANLKELILGSLEGGEKEPTEAKVKADKYVKDLAKEGEIKIKYLTIDTDW